MIYNIIPVFNRWQYTEACLLSLSRQVHRNFKVVVVDLGSTDGTSDAIAKNFPDFIVLNGDSSRLLDSAS